MLNAYALFSLHRQEAPLHCIHFLLAVFAFATSSHPGASQAARSAKTGAVLKGLHHARADVRSHPLVIFSNF